MFIMPYTLYKILVHVMLTSHTGIVGGRNLQPHFKETKVNSPHLAMASAQLLGMEPSTTVPPSVSHNSYITCPLKLHQIYPFVCHSYSQNMFLFFIFLNICSSVLTGLTHLTLLSQTQTESYITKQHGMEVSLNTGSSLLSLSPSRAVL